MTLAMVVMTGIVLYVIIGLIFCAHLPVMIFDYFASKKRRRTNGAKRYLRWTTYGGK